jgi:hypothetical protein
MPRVGERLRVGQVCLFGERAQDRADLLQVDCARPTYRMLSVGSLEEDVDEGAALEVVLAEPFVEDVEDRQQLLLGCGAASFGLCLEPLVRPQLLAAVEESEHEVVLRREVAVERRPGDGGTLDHLERADDVQRAEGEVVGLELPYALVG